VTRPGRTVEGITVPQGDPDALLAAGKQLQGIGTQLSASAEQIASMPSLMSSWSGPGSSVFADTTGQEAAAIRQAGVDVMMAGTSVQISADLLEDAQRRADKAIARAERAREAIDAAKEAIREAIDAQRAARDRMASAMQARQAAEVRLISSTLGSLPGDGGAAAAISAADAAYRAAESDLQDAERREERARDRLKDAEDDLKEARKAGQEAADDARVNGVALQAALGRVPPAVFGALGAPAQAAIGAALPVRPQPPRDVPLSEREPPEHWPGWAKSWFKVGRGEVAAIQGVAGLAQKAYENPEKIPGGVAALAESAWNDPAGFGKALIGYDELANGRIEDWLGQMGVGALGGAIGTIPARGARLNRVVGSPKIEQLGAKAPRGAKAFAGSRLDFAKPNLGARAGERPTIPAKAAELAEKYPKGVRFTRAGYPVFTPYAIERVKVDGLDGIMDHDNPKANAAAGIPGRKPPAGYTWHHVEDGRTMELVPSDLHENVQHTGGRPAIPDQLGEVAPGGVFTPFEHGGAIGGAGAGFGATGPATANQQP
jgi:A nuclease of the HNH/ENDO VII superfamily with conserved WHH